MRLSIQYDKDMVCIDRHCYQLDELRNFLIQHYPQLVQQFFIKAVHRPGHYMREIVTRNGPKIRIQREINHHGHTVFVYDWLEIFRRAERTVLPIRDFTFKYKPVKTRGPMRNPEQQPHP